MSTPTSLEETDVEERQHPIEEEGVIPKLVLEEEQALTITEETQGKSSSKALVVEEEHQKVSSKSLVLEEEHARAHFTTHVKKVPSTVHGMAKSGSVSKSGSTSKIQLAPKTEPPPKSGSISKPGTPSKTGSVSKRTSRSGSVSSKSESISNPTSAFSISKSKKARFSKLKMGGEEASGETTSKSEFEVKARRSTDGSRSSREMRAYEEEKSINYETLSKFSMKGEGEEESFIHELLEATEVEFGEYAQQGEELGEELPGEFRGEPQEEKEKQPEGFLKGIEFGPKFHPFKLKWIFGARTDVSLLNLSTSKKNVIVFGSAQAIVIYDMDSKEMDTLEGHQSALSSISADSTGQYLASSDKGANSCIIIWDMIERAPIFTIYDPYPVEKEKSVKTEESEEWDPNQATVEYGGGFDEEEIAEPEGTERLAISPNAKYLISVAHNVPVIKFWLWTYGKDVADDTYTVTPTTVGECTGLSFHPNCQEHIMVAFEKAVYFVVWNSDNNCFENWKKAETRLRSKYGRITDCTFVENCHECFATAEKGALHVYGNTTYHLPFADAELNPDRFFVKTVLLSRTAMLLTLQTVDGLIVIGDSLGRIMFFDKTIRIIYWFQEFKFSGVSSLSFKLEAKRFQFADPTHFKDEMFVLESPRQILEGDVEDMSDQVEILYKNLVPKDASLKKNPLVIRDFVALTTEANIFSIDFLHGTATAVLTSTKSNVTAMVAHTDFPYIVVAFENGKVSLTNYDTVEEISSIVFPETFNEETMGYVTVSSLSYSPDSYRLACGRSNGELWFLEPILLERKSTIPFIVTSYKVMKIRFSNDSNYCAYYDDNKTVVLMRYSHFHGDWKINGKYRSHCQPITDLMFSPYVTQKFFTIGRDRHIVEYNAKKSTDEEIFIVKREIIEQSAIPLCFSYMQREDDTKPLKLLYGDNQYKYKIILEDNYYQRGTFLGPAYGCYCDNPVNKIINVPGHDNGFFIFATNRHIGIQSLPLCGNPYHFLGMYGHPNQLLDVCLTFDGKYLFTSGQDDPSVLMWTVNYASVQFLKQIGGNDLEPYYCLIEGGPTGWLFKEMQDLFYYMQVLHQDENNLSQRFASDDIPVVELPDLMRACGFYPSEFEVRSLLSDIRHRGNDELRTEATFLEFVQLYVNHRPAHGISMEDLEEVYNRFCDFSGGSYGSVDKEDFLNTICNKGEVFSLANAHKCLQVLMHEDPVPDEGVDDLNFDFFPDTVTFQEFVDDVLGINNDEQKEMIEAD